jgi:hypothetical protein
MRIAFAPEALVACARAEAEAQLVLPRHALHASSIRFTHPLTNKRMEFSAPMPHDLKTFIDTASQPWSLS